MKKCQNCGSNVTDDFAKKLSGNDGKIYACQDCSPNSGIVQESKRRAKKMSSNENKEEEETDESEVSFEDYSHLSYVDN